MGLLDKDALELSGMLEAREVSAEELMRATLERIEAVNGAVNAVVSLRDGDALLAEARAADATPRKGWLHGVPMAVKDLANVAGIETSMGSPLFAGQIPKADDVMVARMRAAGALFIGKTNTPEFGLGSHTFNPVHGATRNPYGLDRSAGGSSGGAAVALATRMLAVADGSDMMGSLRNPAGWNNVYGFRPSWGLVPSEPAGEMFLHQLATNGPMARSPADIAALLEVQAGWDRHQPHGLEAAPYVSRIKADVRGRRIGWLGGWGGAYAMEPGILALCEGALAEFATMGCVIEPVAAPFPAQKLWDSWTTLRSWAIAGNLAPLLADRKMRAGLKPEAIWEAERGIAMSAMEVHRASAVRSEWFRRAAALFEQYDALILPSAQLWPFPVDWAYPQAINGQAMDTYHRWMEVVIPVGLIGLPCLNIPAGFGTNGLPMGMQMFGPARGDLGLLQLGHAWHEATNWPARRPPILP
ncbi:amidase [Thalassovita taeanensis]|uniref:Amidase n=1 Tax=Thalassovita taeanensis TaxID=657014 RepID=A0A1H8YS24_9RHOB|nr:amidase [Thalassovita taeanensis]SEP55024.1 amidase [Thalassovita taeanensis]